MEGEIYYKVSEILYLHETMLNCGENITEYAAPKYGQM